MKNYNPIKEIVVKILVTHHYADGKKTTEHKFLPMSPPEDMLWMFHALWDCAATAVAKNADYSQGDKWYDNFTGGGLKGIVNRMQDKFCRLVNLLNKGKAAVKDESFEDTCMDLATYSLLLMQAQKEGLSLDGELWK